MPAKAGILLKAIDVFFKRSLDAPYAIRHNEFSILLLKKITVSTFLGIDPGSRITGYGIIHAENNQLKRVCSGIIRTKATEPSNKLLEIFEGLEKIILEYAPQEAAIEKVFVHHNPSGALTLGQARGTAMVAIAKFAISIAEYSARQIKQAVVGYGAAEKSQVAHMVKLQLNYREELSQDEADALACAICHSSTRQSVLAIKKQEQAVKQYKSYKKGRVK